MFSFCLIFSYIHIIGISLHNNFIKFHINFINNLFGFTITFRFKPSLIIVALYNEHFQIDYCYKASKWYYYGFNLVDWSIIGYDDKLSDRLVTIQNILGFLIIRFWTDYVLSLHHLDYYPIQSKIRNWSRLRVFSTWSKASRRSSSVRYVFLCLTVLPCCHPDQQTFLSCICDKCALVCPLIRTN